MLPNIISLNQIAFIKGRKIVDNILLAQEMIGDLDKKGRGGDMVIKLDIRMAFDTINWNFIIFVLRLRGFNEKFICIIKGILEENINKVLINSNPFGFFKMERGVKQGDPLSPTLFIFSMDFLSRLIDE